MSFLFGSPKIEAPAPVRPPTPPPPPPSEQKDVDKIKEDEKKKIRKGRERRGTLLTGPRGILTHPPTEQKTLLGE